MKGKIVLLPFPFTNLASTKRRPALILLEKKILHTEKEKGKKMECKGNREKKVY